MSLADRTEQENIYKDVIEKIESLLSETSNEDLLDARVTMLYQSAKNQLSSIREDLTKELLSLQKHAEWDCFTIAFYGETNAGKSTLIEALRILLAEETKINDRDAFDDGFKKLIELQEEYSKVERQLYRILEERDSWLHDINTSINEAISRLETIDNRYKYAVALIEANNSARADLRKNSTEDFFNVLFGKDEYSVKNASLREEIPRLKNEYKECKAHLDKDKETLGKEDELFVNRIAPLDEKKTILEQKIRPLSTLVESHRDGQIIGTGKQDFTQEVTEYEFIINNQRLKLLDLPGIEGKESQYIELITSALEKAHMVFYISRYSRPPQNGDDKISMISKVGKQLSGQTEVFFVYNRPGNNATQVMNIPVINGDKLESLKDVDNIMSELLGEKYLGHLVVSAMPAYLAKSNNYGESETAKKFKKRQDKLLTQFSPEDLIRISNISEIIDLFNRNLLANYREKIIKANCHKVLNSLTETEKNIAALGNKFKELQETISSELSLSFKAIDARLNSMVNELRDARHTVTQQFILKSNEILYGEIDKGVDDDELSDKIKEVFEDQSKKAIELFNVKLKELGDIYAQDVADINNKYQKYFSENIVLFSDTSELGFEYEPVVADHNKKRYVDAAWIVGEIVGTLVFFSTSSAAVLVITILGLIIRVGRFIVKSIDPESNKAFQCQDLDLNVKNAAAELEKTLQGHNEIIIERMEDNNRKIKEKMNNSLKELDNSISSLKNAENGIRLINDEYRNEWEACS